VIVVCGVMVVVMLVLTVPMLVVMVMIAGAMIVAAFNVRLVAVVMGVHVPRSAGLLPQGDAPDERDEGQRNAAAEHEQMELRAEQELQHRRRLAGAAVNEIECEADRPERPRYPHHADLVEVVGVVAVVVVVVAGVRVIMMLMRVVVTVVVMRVGVV
jgi:Flp pilus assembly protein TadB